MADHLRVYAAYLWELCTAVVLPFEYVSVADQFIERLDELKAGAEGVGLDGAADRARAFRAAAERLEPARAGMARPLRRRQAPRTRPRPRS